MITLSIANSTEMSQKINYAIKNINQGIKKYISELQLSNHTPGFSILIKKDNEIIYKKSVGKSIISSNSPKSLLSSDSCFLCASLTKPVICQFFIDLNVKYPKLIQASLNSFFSPKHKKPHIKKITVQHLLTHKSGLPEYFGSISSIPYHQLNKFSLNQISKYILDQEKTFSPGKKMEYSNSSFVILSKVVELLFNNKYELELEKYFESRGLFKNTFFFTKKINCRTAQYVKINKKYIRVPWDRAFIGWGDGALISSPLEYLDLINPLKDERILNYLFKTRSDNFKLCYQHTGGSIGMSNLYFFIPQVKLRGVCFQNFTNSFDRMSISQDIYNFLSGNRTYYI